MSFEAEKPCRVDFRAFGHRDGHRRGDEREFDRAFSVGTQELFDVELRHGEDVVAV